MGINNFTPIVKDLCNLLKMKRYTKNLYAVAKGKIIGIDGHARGQHLPGSTGQQRRRRPQHREPERPQPQCCGARGKRVAGGIELNTEH